MGLPSPELTHRVIGAMYHVHNKLGIGFLEAVYEAALAKVLRDRGLRAERQHALDVTFEGEVIGTFRADLLIEGQLLVELKVVHRLLPIHDAQVLNYLRASGLRLGLLANFARQVEVRRLVL